MNRVVVEVGVLVAIPDIEIIYHNHSVFYVPNIMS